MICVESFVLHWVFVFLGRDFVSFKEGGLFGTKFFLKKEGVVCFHFDASGLNVVHLESFVRSAISVQ